jgi:hypothetical protein
VLENNTISNNSATYGGAMYCAGGSPTLTNCIFWGNTAGVSGSQIFLYDESSDPNFYYSNVEGGISAFELNNNFYTGTYQNNINILPQFITPSAGSGTGFNGVTAKWSLQSTSPCIDKGDPSGTYPAIDIANNSRISGSIIDIGAYEFQGLTTGMAHNAENDLFVYPNPAHTSFSIRSSSSQNLIVHVFDLSGKQVLTNIVSGEEPIFGNTLEEGVYILEIKSNSGTVYEKLIIAE